MTEEDRCKAERLADIERFTNGPGHCEGVAFVRGYAAACEAKRDEIEDLKSELHRAAQYMREAHQRFTPEVTNSHALDFIEKWWRP